MIVGVPKELKEHEYRVGMVPAGVAELASGRDVLGAMRPRLWWVAAAAAAMFAGWGLKLAIGLAAGELPIR